MEIYIYTLSHPITNEVRYVGKTINIKRRYKQHLYDKRTSHKASWVKSLKNDGLKPVMNILEICTFENWEEKEKYWIKQFNNLTNLKAGGNDSYKRTTTEETKQKLSLAHKGKTLSEDHKAKIKNNNARSKKIIIDDIEYNSALEASKILNIGSTTIDLRLKSKNFPNYLYK